MSQADYTRQTAALDAAIDAEFAAFQARGGDLQAAAAAMHPASAIPSAAPSVRRMFEPLAGELAAPHPLAQFVEIDTKPRAPKWIIPSFIGEGLAAIAGSHGVGKTTALLPLAMVAAGLHGQGDPLAPTRWRHVVYVTEDIDQAQRILAGIVKYGGLGLSIEAVRERLHLVEARRLEPATVVEVAPTYRAKFTRRVDGVEVLPLVVFDTKSAVFDQPDENSNSDASAIVSLLKQRFESLPAWVVGHLAKTNVGRIDANSLSMRGGGAFECDANQVLFLVKEGDGRFLVRGKTRFESPWPELQVTGHCADTVAVNQFGESERITLRWSTSAPPAQNRKEAQKEAQEAERQAEAAALRTEIRDAIQSAWQIGHPLNREAAKAKVKHKTQGVTDAIQNLLSERWLHEVHIPAKERTNPKRASFLVNLTTEEHEAVMRGEELPPAKLAIPQSWRKPSAPSVPANDTQASQGTAIVQSDKADSVHSQSVHSLRETPCGTDGRGLETPRHPTISEESGTNGNGREWTGTDGTDGTDGAPTRTMADEPDDAAPGAVAGAPEPGYAQSDDFEAF